MPRRVLLIEPNFKNKYPPMGLMKLSTYHKMLGDSVTFYKGDPQKFVLNDIYEELAQKLINIDNKVEWKVYKNLLIDYISKGSSKSLERILELSNDTLIKENMKYYRNYYYKKEYFENPKWDRICITTLFTFYWNETINTINFFKRLCKNISEVKVGGIAASVVPAEIEKETGIKPFEGLLDHGGEYDQNDIIIDHLPLDYSILDEIDYIYPEHDGYYGYMTRGCVNRCSFCSVPKIEPNYNCFISIKKQIEYVREKFGEKRNLLLLDNNVLASEKYNDIIDEIKECGFDKKTKYVVPNLYSIAINGLRSGYNDKGYIKNIVKQYAKLNSKLSEKDQIEVYQVLKSNKLLDDYTAEKKTILELDEYFIPYFEKIYRNKPKERYVDFNQGVDARLITEEKISKLSEISIRPLRIAFDDWKLHDIYEKAIRLAAKYNIKEMSNYLLYNYQDDPVDLYRRMRLNVELCEELNVSIYSFPMKYHPIQDPAYFRNRTYTGIHWNRKFVRAIQAILNSTKGKVGRGKSFFEEAFGKDENEFEKMLYMPEAMIIYRMYYKENGMVERWWKDFSFLSSEKREQLKLIVQRNNFEHINQLSHDIEILNVLQYYTIQREDAEKVLNVKEAL